MFDPKDIETTFTGINDLLNPVLINSVEVIYDNISRNLAANLTQVIVIIYFAITGWRCWLALGKTGPHDLLITILKCAVFVAAFNNIGGVVTYFSGKLILFPDHITKAVSCGIVPSCGGPQEYIAVIMSAGFQKAEAFSVYASTFVVPHPLYVLMSFTLLVCTVLLSALSASIWLGAKVIFVIILAILPIMIVFSLFDVTKQYLMGWIDIVLSTMFLPVMNAVVGVVCALMITHGVNTMTAPLSENNVLNVYALTLLVFSISGGLIAMTPVIVQKIFSGAAIGLGTTFAGHANKKIINSLKDGAQLTKKMVSELKNININIKKGGNNGIHK